MHLPEPDHHDDECVESSELELSGDVAACLDIGTATDTSQTEKATTNEKKTHGCSRSISSLPNACPRFFSIFVRIILPLWLLIALAVLGGFFLAEFEAPNELRNNDLIMANKFTLVRNSNTSDKYADYVAEAPERCFVDFLDGIEVKGTNLTVADIVAEKVNPEVKGTNLTVADIVAEKVNPFGPKDEEILEDIMHDILFLKNFSRYMDPTFDWIRCWNESETGPLNPFRPNSKQIEAASSQDIFYYEAWDQDRIRIYNQCVMEHGNFSNEKASEINCYFEAVENATGSKHCSNNIAGTSWFWFTVMTTIGYGNQAPVTTSGRAMVSVFGFLSILAFGFILSSSGAILSVIVDDVISRCRLHVLLRPLVSLFLWGIVAGGWIMILGIITSNWWNSRYGVEEAPTKWWDSVWFAYISTTTVGLGDFFLFPEIMFYEDVFRFSILFLTSFVFMSTFLNGFVQALASLRADPSATLRNRIAKASSDRKPINIQKKRDKDMTNETGTTLEVLRELLCYELSDGHKGQRLATIVEEEELLRNLLERKSAERMQIELEGD